MSYSSMQNTLDSPGTLSPLAGPSERSAYDQLIALARAQSPSPLSSETPGAPTGPGNTPGASFGAPSTGNFGRDAGNFGRAAGQAALGMMANPASIPGSVLGAMVGAAIRGVTNQPNPTSLRGALGLSAITNAITGAVRGQPSITSEFGSQVGDKPGSLSPADAQAQTAAATANNDFGGQKSGWGGPDYGGGGKGVGGDGGAKGGSEDVGMASSLGGAAGGGQSGSQDSGGASGANLAVGGLIPFAEGGNIVRGLGGGLDDLIPTTINGRRAAALSDGEFVIPADVVSMMGDGSTDAGARRLYDFMNTVRQHKTGSTKQAGPLPIGDILKRSLR